MYTGDQICAGTKETDRRGLEVLQALTGNVTTEEKTLGIEHSWDFFIYLFSVSAPTSIYPCMKSS